MQRFMLKKMIKPAMIVSLVVSHSLSFAAPIPPTLPSTVLPERAGSALSTVPASNPRALAPEQAKSAPADSPLGAKASKVKFKLTKVTLIENKVYSDAQLKSLYQAKLNKVITIAQLQGIVQSITNYYRNQGYILTRAILPPQKVKDGAVKIQVIEGYVGKINVVGKPRGAKEILNGYGSHIVESRPLQLKVMEHYLLLSNELPGVRTKAVLEPSKSSKGASDLNLVTETKLGSAYFSYDNYGTLYIGPNEISTGGEIDSIFRSGDSTQLNYATSSKANQLDFIQVLHNTPIGTKGIRFIVSANQAKTQPGLALQSLLVKGTANTSYVMIQYPLIRSRSKNVTLDGSFNYSDSIVLYTSAQSTLYVDHLRSLRIGANVDSADAWLGANSFSSHLEVGVPILGATSVAQGNSNVVQTSRAGASGNFTKLEMDVSRLQQLGKSRFALYGIAKGQYAFQPLLASAQFGFGGVQQAMGRGYDSAEIIGDRGLSGSAEVRINFIPEIRTQFYVFYDAGRIWNIKNLPNQKRNSSAVSAGLGARLYPFPFVTGNFLIAQPLTKKVDAYTATNKNSKSLRAFFGVTASL